MECKEPLHRLGGRSAVGQGPRGGYPRWRAPQGLSLIHIFTLEDGVLFDFGKSDIRPDAAQTLKSLAGVLNNAKVPTAHIYGHTDSISDEAFNLQLSQERADAVSAELKKDGVSAMLDATGYGESKPIAPNENADGSDNPAGRALNRRVEIFIPAF